ncbi:MAG TPA: amino acid adenylation domain-containing protein [Longimicrobiaceae bacterium]|jgi:amino acid adenylation domain-containing protein|nr:amino acid adenylation domain-containing protein [Longimicrobiaceae bacterium]
MAETTTGAPAASADDKRLRLAALLQKKAAAPKTYPASFLQQRLWFLDQLDPGSLAYILPGGIRLRGPLDSGALMRALDEIVRRHDALRTSIRTVDGKPVQVVEPACSLELAVESLEDLADAEARTAEEERRSHAFVMQPFDLAKAPLMRALLLRLAPDEHVLVLAVHHIVADGWSIGILIQELNQLYAAFSRGEPSPLKPLAVQYPDFAAWQHTHFQGEELQRQLAFWRGLVEGAPAVLDLPTDRPRPSRQDNAGATTVLELDAGLVDAVSALARTQGATAFMVLLAVFDVLLYRVTGQDDVVVGTPIAGRTRSELEPIFGYFANTLALRTRMDGDPTFGEVVQRVRKMMLGVYANQDLPFEKLVDELKVERSLGHNPLFQVLFALQNAGGSKLDLEDVDVAGVSVETGTTIFDLSFQVGERDGAYYVAIEYKTGLFDEESMLRMGRQFETLLLSLTADPAQRISRPTLLDADDHRTLLEEWTATERDLGPASTVHALFERQARATPDATAILFGDASLSYVELNARANRLARHLQSLGVGADVPVAISVDRSPEMVVGLLAVLKAGGAYLPVDPAYPKDRRAYMLEDSGATVLLTTSKLAADLPDHSARIVLLDQHPEDAASADDSDLSVDVDPSSLAYIIYTSGSTGRPKGVMVPHDAVANLARAQIEAFGISSESRVLQFASFSFDAAVSEVLTALLAGATLVLAPQDALMPGDPLIGTLREMNVTVATLPPSVLTAMPETEFPHLQTLVSAGEACSAEIVTRWGDGRRFLNAYGPTEATVCATIAAEETGERRPTIGKPMANTRSYVLDARGWPVAVGVFGELHLGGSGVARGYTRRPSLTAEKFLPDPYAYEPGGRMYRTGDRVRWRADGTLEFAGRIDEQVKLRGFRIEPGEVESVLRAHPAVADAVVVPRESAAGDLRLVGYVVPADEGKAPGTAELRAHALERLPEYMVPAAFVTLDAFPLTPNGKVDRRALPAPDAERAGVESAYVAPSTPTEEKLAAIWSELLGVERVGVNDNFFELGGHSLNATQVVSRVRTVLGGELQLRTMFESPTVAALAAHLDAASGSEAARPQAPRIVRVAREGRVRPPEA